jgi:hypothetical protein
MLKLHLKLLGLSNKFVSKRFILSVVSTLLFASGFLITGADIAEAQRARATTPLEETTGDLAEVCPAYRELGNCQYKNNSPIRSGSLSSPITRFALNPTIIFTNEKGYCGDQAKLASAAIYDKNGNRLCSRSQRLSCATKKGSCLSRYKASEISCNTRKVRRQALAKTKSPEIYWRVSSKYCIRVPDVGRCYNVKVRDLCSGTVK